MLDGNRVLGRHRPEIRRKLRPPVLGRAARSGGGGPARRVLSGGVRRRNRQRTRPVLRAASRAVLLGLFQSPFAFGRDARPRRRLVRRPPVRRPRLRRPGQRGLPDLPRLLALLLARSLRLGRRDVFVVVERESGRTSFDGRRRLRRVRALRDDDHESRRRRGAGRRDERSRRVVRHADETTADERRRPAQSSLPARRPAVASSSRDDLAHGAARRSAGGGGRERGDRAGTHEGHGGHCPVQDDARDPGLLDALELRRHRKYHARQARLASRRDGVELEQLEHAVLGHWVYFRRHVRGRRETILSHGHQGPPRTVRAQERQGQQGLHRLQHHVRRRPVPSLPQSALEVPQDRGEQALRVHARAASRRAGHGLRHVPQNSAQVQAQVRDAAARRGAGLRARLGPAVAANH
mmetsp:Transcript_228/g.657  ORF Transcript_228/g.657 Transcript_228/m.657 type:complete len:409 (-) Transcript_228:508-1734(-)